MIAFQIGILACSSSFAAEPNCTPDGNVCGTVIEPNSAERLSGLRDWSLGPLLEGLQNAIASHLLLTSSIVALIGISGLVAAVVSFRPRRSRQQKDFRIQNSGRRTTLLQKIHTSTDELEERVERIQDTLRNKLPHEFFREQASSDAERRELEPTDSVQILRGIGRELARVSTGLAEVRRDTDLLQKLRTNLDTEKAGSSGRKFERLLEQNREEIEEHKKIILRLTDEIDSLSNQLHRTKDESANATRIMREAEDLLSRYMDGMPAFISSRENGCHFPTFLDFLLKTNAAKPNCVFRLGMMLRVSADAITREDNNFELIWSVHEVGRALYSLMQALGHDNVWQYEEASAWAHALNKYGGGRYTVFVPVVKSPFSGLEMTGGAPQSPIQEVKSWGVRNRRGDVERKAIVK